MNKTREPTVMRAADAAFFIQKNLRKEKKR